MKTNKKIKVGSDCAGVGAFPQSLRKLDINFTEKFACDFDYFARVTYCKNYGTDEDYKLALTKEHKTYADSVKKIALSSKPPSAEDEKILNEANQFAKLFSFYFPFNMYQREIPKEPLDIYVGSFPCQSFSLAGSRKGEEDKRGILFYCGHNFIKKNKPRYFIIENVKGLLSDDKGKTFQRWCDFLGGKTINGNPTIFPHEEAVPYHIYYQVLNAKHYGVPQNRERIFIIGIRDDEDNNFNFPKPFPLEKRLKDVLEDNVDEKYYLSDKMIDFFIKHTEKHTEKGNGFKFKTKNFDEIGNTITNPSKNRMDDNFIKIQSATTKGYEVAEIGEDSINLEHPNSETRRGRVGKSVAQTLTTSCNQGVAIGAIGCRNIDNPKSRESGLPTTQMLEINENGTSNCLTTVQKDNVVIENYRIRKLTPKEVFRLMDFPDDFNFSVVSDSQAYKQAGNSIVVNVLSQIISKLNL